MRERRIIYFGSYIEEIERQNRILTISKISDLSRALKEYNEADRKEYFVCQSISDLGLNGEVKLIKLAGTNVLALFMYYPPRSEIRMYLK